MFGVNGIERAVLKNDNEFEYFKLDTVIGSG